MLSGIKAVQTLSRLNRAHQKKHDVFVLDFLNDTDAITKAFSEYYRTTILADETDPNNLHDLQSDLDGAQVYSPEQVTTFVKRFLADVDREQLDPILDQCVAVYINAPGEDEQVVFKSKAKEFVRTYAFLSSILPYNNLDWEERSTFLNFLIPKLPAPEDPDLSKGILEMIDMDRYRGEKRAIRNIILEDEDAEIDRVPGEGAGGRREPELDRLSNIIAELNNLFGGIEWEDTDRIHQMITEDIPAKVAEDYAFRNARQNSDRENARIEHDKALGQVMVSIMKDDKQLYQQFEDDEDFREGKQGVCVDVRGTDCAMSGWRRRQWKTRCGNPFRPPPNLVKDVRQAARGRCSAARMPNRTSLNATGIWGIPYELSSFRSGLHRFGHQDAETAVQLGAWRCDPPPLRTQTDAPAPRLDRSNGRVGHVSPAPQRRVHLCRVRTVS